MPRVRCRQVETHGHRTLPVGSCSVINAATVPGRLRKKRNMKPLRALVAPIAAAATLAAASTGLADNITADYEEDGKFFTSDGIPTFTVSDDGAVDWYTFSGFRRYHSECHVCHGPDGEGSTYAPAIKTSAIDMDYYDFIDVVVNGRSRIGAADNQVMPPFGLNKNVMCYLDDIYVYLKARGADAVGRGRPAKKAPKPKSFAEAENACHG